MNDYFVLRIRKSLIGSVAVLIASSVSIIFLVEIALQIIWPQEYMTPTYRYSDKYINFLFENTAMIEEKPGEWRFTYTINSYGYRGKLVKPSNKYLNSNIVVLGDSYAFGEGVTDGDEFSAVLEHELKGQFDVINLGVPGWGLTQEIRRYFEFGILFNPKIVILQFSGNDPLDNLAYPVTRVRDGRLIFEENNRLALKRLNKWLANSFIQRLQSYNFIKQRLWRLYVTHQKSMLAAEQNPPDKEKGIPFEEKHYIELFGPFVKSVGENQTHVIFIPVGESLRKFPFIAKQLRKLSGENPFFHLLETAPWFEGIENYSSPEGHKWGKKAHQVVGRNLARFVNGLAGLNRQPEKIN